MTERIEGRCVVCGKVQDRWLVMDEGYQVDAESLEVMRHPYAKAETKYVFSDGLQAVACEHDEDEVVVAIRLHVSMGTIALSNS